MFPEFLLWCSGLRSQRCLCGSRAESVAKKKKKKKKRVKETKSLTLYFIFLFYFLFFRAATTAYVSSQARGRIRATDAGLHHNHSNARSLTHWARPGMEPESSWILVGFISAEPQRELPLNLKIVCPITWISLCDIYIGCIFTSKFLIFQECIFY